MGLGTWFRELFKKDVTKLFLDLIYKAVRLFIGRVAEDLQAIALDEVRKAETTGADGLEKYKMAYAGIRARLKNDAIPEYLINLAIESAVAVIDSKL